MNNTVNVPRRTVLKAAAMLAAPALATAQGRSLGIVVPQPAGNPSDVFIRKMLPVLQRVLGRAVIVENLPGAGGAIGVQKVLNAPADGMLALMVSQTEPILTPLAQLSARYTPEALRPVGWLGHTSYVLAGRPGLPAGTHAELKALALGAVGKPLAYGHIGQGSMIHLLGAQWERLTGSPLVHVPYKGVPPLVQDLMGGQIDLSFLPLGGSSLPLIETGKLRVYGVSAALPAPLLPQVAPLSVQDSALKGFVHGAWGALMVARTTPAALVQPWHEAFAAAMRDDEVLAFVRSQGTAPQAPLGLDALDTLYHQEIRTYQQLSRSLGIVAQ